MRTLTIRGGLVADGTGGPLQEADVLVEGACIREVGPGPYPADTVLDAAGCVVAPGFIDIHAHSDLSLMVDRRGLSKLFQGVTLEVVGNCGMSPAPLLPGQPAPRDAMTYIDQDLPWDWPGYREFLGQLDGCALDVASLVGHIALRVAAMGFERRRPTAAELDTMRGLLGEALDAGAVGYTTGLIYPPSCYADTEELVALAEVVASRNALYASHIRGEGRTLQTSIAEAITIGRRSGCRVQISHLKAAGRPNWGGVAPAIEQIEAARAEGIDVAMDVYPYAAGATQLAVLLPPWVHEGGREAMLTRLADPEVRAQIRAQTENPPPDWPGYPLRGREEWEARKIGSTHRPENEWMVGRSIWEIAETLELHPCDTVCEILRRDDGRTSFIAFHIDESEMRTALAHPLSAVGSDGLAVAADGPTVRGRPHPRFFGTFPRVLGKYVREERLFSLPEAIRKMTSWPAQRLGLRDVGRVAPGYRANLVLFDPKTVCDTATFEEPCRFPVGIEAVIVGGQLVARGHHATDERPGRVVRLPG